jgi:hypothetical protein
MFRAQVAFLALLTMTFLPPIFRANHLGNLPAERWPLGRGHRVPTRSRTCRGTSLNS